MLTLHCHKKEISSFAPCLALPWVTIDSPATGAIKIVHGYHRIDCLQIFLCNLHTVIFWFYDLVLNFRMLLRSCVWAFFQWAPPTFLWQQLSSHSRGRVSWPQARRWRDLFNHAPRLWLDGFIYFIHVVQNCSVQDAFMPQFNTNIFWTIDCRVECYAHRCMQTHRHGINYSVSQNDVYVFDRLWKISDIGFIRQAV